MFRSRDIKSSCHKVFRSTEFYKLHCKVRNPCACHEVCAYRQRFTQSTLQGSRSAAPAMKSAVPVCSSEQSAAPATGPATEGAQSAACKVPLLPRSLLLEVLTKSALPMHKVPLLPRNLLLEVLKVLRLPRNLQFQCTKCRSCHEICYWRCSKCCARHEICSSSAQSAAPATKSVIGDA